MDIKQYRSSELIPQQIRLSNLKPQGVRHSTELMLSAYQHKVSKKYVLMVLISSLALIILMFIR